MAYHHHKKYVAYLRGEYLPGVWQEKQRAVKERCGGVCERCKTNPMSEVHHLTYCRLYHEDLDDLLACCQSCHRRLHGLPGVPTEEEIYRLLTKL